MTSSTGQLLETLTDGVAALIDSEQWAAMLAAAAKFHCYSANNQLLILLQAPQATRIAGFRRWQALGRQVRKGEGIAILAPCLYRPTKTDTAGGSTAPAPTMARQPARKAPDSCAACASRTCSMLCRPTGSR